MTLVIAGLAALLAWLAVRWFLQRAPRYGRGFLLRLLVGVLVIVFIALAVSGRLHWLLVLGGALLPFLRRLLPYLLPLLRLLPLVRQQHQQHRSSRRSSGQHSRVQTRWLTMTLDHDSGDISGEITQGPYAGRRVEELDMPSLHNFYHLCQQEDPEAIRLLDAYIQRHCAEQWEQQERTSGDQESHDGPSLTVSEAWAILGLEPGASREEVLKAYKRMMLKVHPDRGGSNYLAARINEAKALLLKQF